MAWTRSAVCLEVVVQKSRNGLLVGRAVHPVTAAPVAWLVRCVRPGDHGAAANVVASCGPFAVVGSRAGVHAVAALRLSTTA